MNNTPNTQLKVTLRLTILVTFFLAGTTAFALDYFHLGGTNPRFDQATNYSNINGSSTPATVAPGASDNLFFYNSLVAGPENRTFELGATARTYNSLTFGSNAGTTQINRDVVTNNTTHLLGIGAGGITVDSGAGPVTFGAAGQRVAVGAFADYTVANNSSSDLTFFREFDGRNTNAPSTVTVAGSGDGDTIFKDIRSYDANRDLAMTINKTSGAGVVRFDGSNTYRSPTTVTAGTLIINGSTAATSILSVAVGANLGGSGTVGGAATISGNLRPGNSAGLLTFSSSLTLESAASTTMEINGSGTRGTDFDGINVGTQLTYGGNLTLDFGSTFELGTYTFNLFDFGSQTGSFDTMGLSGDYTGALSNSLGVWTLSQANTFGGNNTWTFSESTGDLGLNVVPEPTTWMLLVGSLAALAVFHRRRRS